MNTRTLVRIRTVFGTADGNQEFVERHIAVRDIPGELTQQASRCGLNGNIKVVKLTLSPEVEQPPEEPEESETYPVYGVPDLSKFYEED